jgi:FkbM family methyltransferase
LDELALQRLRDLLDEQIALLEHEAIARCDSRRGLRERTGSLLEAAFLDLAIRLAPDLSVEIGAHEASFSERLKAGVANLRAVAFEANPYVYARHADRLQRPESGVDYRHAAICDHDGSVEFRIPVKRGKGALRRENAISSLRLRANAEFEYETLMVPAATLDTALGPRPAIRAVAWVDAEGAQKEILAGGRAFFSTVAAVYIEVERQQVWQDQAVDREIGRRLARFSLVPVMRDNLARPQFNEVYIRPASAIAGAARPAIEAYVEGLRRLVEGAPGETAEGSQGVLCTSGP